MKYSFKDQIKHLFKRIQYNSLSCYIFVGSGYTLELMPSFKISAKKILKEFSLSANPQQAEILFIVGDINHKSAAVLKFHYEQLNTPTFVIHIHKTDNKTTSYAQILDLKQVIPIHLIIEADFLAEESISLIIKQIKNRFNKVNMPADKLNPTEAETTHQKVISKSEYLKEQPVKKQEKQKQEKQKQEKQKQEKQKKQEQNTPAHIGHLYRLTKKRLGIQKFKDYQSEGFNEWAEINPDHLLTLCRFYKNDKDTALNILVDITAQQSSTNHSNIEVIYFFRSTLLPYKVQLSVNLKAKQLNLPSITSIYPSANWLERELFDLFGIRFEGHPNLKRLLLYPGFMGHPLLKTYPLTRSQPLIPIRSHPVWSQTIRIPINDEKKKNEKKRIKEKPDEKAL